MTECPISSTSRRRSVRAVVALCIVLVAVLMATQTIIPSVSAEENSTLIAKPFITIDPIGNHTFGDVFIIHGTTNLPVSDNSSLLGEIGSVGFTPGGNRGEFVYSISIPIMPGVNGTNLWSIDVTDIGMRSTYDYFIEISSGKLVSCNRFPGCVEPEILANQVYTLLPANTHTASSPSPTQLTYQVTSTSPSPAEPFLTFDPIGNHTIGDVFFINGTTNLPVFEHLTMDIVSYKYIERTHMKFDLGPSPDESAYIPVISISSDLSGTNRWSVNVTDTVKKLESGEYIVDIYSQINFSCNTAGCNIPKADTMQIFMLLPANNDTPLNVLQTTVQNPSPIQPTTSATILPPTKQIIPLPLALPIAGLVMMGILRYIQGKKRE